MDSRLSVAASIVALAVALLVALGCAGPGDAFLGPVGGQGRIASGPLKVLVIHGGDFHDFEGNLAQLIAGMPLPPDTHFSFLPLGGAGTDGVSKALHMRQLETLALPGDNEVILAYTQGELGLSPTAKSKLLAFVNGGGGFVGLHCAADSHPGWTQYTQLLGASFQSHPPFGPVTVELTDEASTHPVTRDLPDVWTLPDEFYHLKDLQLGDATLLMTGVSPAGGEERPVTWAKRYGQGRVVYTILGHGPEAHLDRRYRQLVAQALLWASGRS